MPHERPVNFSLRLFPGERALMDATARRYGLTLSSWLRAIALAAAREPAAPASSPFAVGEPAAPETTP